MTDLLDLTLASGADARDPDALARVVLPVPRSCHVIRARGGAAAAAAADALGQRIGAALAAYAGTRLAVAEMTTPLRVLVLGVLTIRALTPGMNSMARGVADTIVYGKAVADVLLRQTLSGVRYGVFLPDTTPQQVAATVAGLIMLGSVFAAFARVLADPVQSRSGVHRRRLGRLLDPLEVD